MQSIQRQSLKNLENLPILNIKKIASHIKLVIKPKESHSITKVIALDSNGKEKEYVTQCEIVDVISEANKTKYTLCYNTPLLQQPMLHELGPNGSGPAVQDILEGTYQPPETLDEITKEYIQHLKYAKQNNEEVPIIIVQDHRYNLQKTKENKSSSPSGLHYGLWKANGQNDILAQVDTIFCNLTYRWGVVLNYWLKVVDIALLKEKGNYWVNRFCTICLIEGDHQFDAKRLERTRMQKAEIGGTNDFIADEQYGSCKKHCAIEIVLN